MQFSFLDMMLAKTGSGWQENKYDAKHEAANVPTAKKTKTKRK